MMRAFDEHHTRVVKDLDGLWDFRLLGNADVESIDPTTITYDDRIAVPGSFDATPRYAGTRGLVAYRRGVEFVDATRHRLVLNGVHHFCRAFVVQNGETIPLGDHAGGFTRFALDITGHRAGQADLVLLVDNRFDSARCPTHLPYFDWYHYGGICRGAELERLGTKWIDSVRVTTVDYAERQVEISVACAADADGTGTHALSIAVDDNEVASLDLELGAGPSSVMTTVSLAHAKLWSPEHPELHTVTCRLGDDDLTDRFGIRQVAIDGAQILINGEEVTLLGFCRHEAHPEFGCGLPAAMQIEDLQLLEAMGANFVRGSHYPQDPRFLDLCDERGILVWNEATGWQHTVEHFADPAFIEAQRINIGEMIASGRNHPSVIMWGLQNESHSEDESNRPGYETLIGEIRSLDPSRPVTYASNRWPEDRFHDLIDIVSINTYPGWYDGEIADIGERLDAFVEAVDISASAGKPIIISEIGAGAVPGFRDRNRSRWSEEYQEELLERVLDHLFLHRDRVAGVALWQFCDIRTAEETRRALMRPRGFNNKGVVDEYRRPKLAFETVKRLFEEIATCR